MKRILYLVVFALVLALPSSAGTIFVGFDDAIGLDYDYQDLVFSISGAGLQLNGNGFWVPNQPSLTSAASAPGNTGLLNHPFFNQTSMDGSSLNIGYCIWGGGACNGGTGLLPNANYLTTDAMSTAAAVDGVTFSGSGNIGVDISLHLAGGSDLLGWYDVANPASIHWLNSVGTQTGTATFTPNGTFGLVGRNTSMNYTFYSQSSVGGDSDRVGHFAYFNDQTAPLDSVLVEATPEPGSILLAMSAIAGIVLKMRKKSA